MRVQCQRCKALLREGPGANEGDVCPNGCDQSRGVKVARRRKRKPDTKHAKRYRTAKRELDEIAAAGEAAGKVAEKTGEDISPMLVMAFIDAERRYLRALAGYVGSLPEPVAPTLVRELAALVLSVEKPEPEDPDYEEWAAARRRAR